MIARGTYENSLNDPYSILTGLITQLFCMEFGSPPLYSEINRVCRTRDKNYLRDLGPFVKAFSFIVSESEQNKLEKIDNGQFIQMHIGGNYNNMAGSFLIFKGGLMMTQQLDKWSNLLNSKIRDALKIVKLSPFITYTSNLSHALSQAIPGKKH